MLYVVATPIGNTKDITLRALEVLQGADLILAEDTRKTRTLLNKYEVELSKKFNAPIERLDDHIIDSRLENLVNKIENGVDAVLVSNAGTPGVSDPGHNLIRLLVERGVKICPIPGPSALASILSVANFATEPNVFYGFLPKKKGRETALNDLKNYATKYGAKSFIIYESPKRIIKTLGDLGVIFGGDANLVIGRELTKQFEQVWHGTIAEAMSQFLQPKGEFVILLQLSNKS